MTRTGYIFGCIGAAALLSSWTAVYATESLAPNEVVAAVGWTTSGPASIVDADNNGLKETLLPNTSEKSAHPLQERSLFLVILDVVSFGIRNLPVAEIDPFWQTEFNYEPIALDESEIPAEGSDASVPYVGGYGPNLEFATAVYASSGVVEGLAYPIASETPGIEIDPVVEISGRSGSIDCCQASDLRSLSYGTPSDSGRWLDTSGDGVADTNVEELLADNGLSAGDMTMTIQNLSRTCLMLPYIRGECEVAQGQILATTFAVPLQFTPPTPAQCDLNEDGEFSLADVKMFAIGCKRDTATWACDLDENGQISLVDGLRFVLGCQAEPATQANYADAARQVVQAMRQRF